MCGILLSAVILMVLVKIVAKDYADPEFWPLLGVVIVVTLAGIAGDLLLTPLLGPFAGLTGIVVLVPALSWACDLPLKQALIVTALYVLVNVGLALAIIGLLGTQG